MLMNTSNSYVVQILVYMYICVLNETDLND